VPLLMYKTPHLSIDTDNCHSSVQAARATVGSSTAESILLRMLTYSLTPSEKVLNVGLQSGQCISRTLEV